MSEDVKTDIVKRTVTRSLDKPYAVGDEQRDWLIEELIAAMEQVNKINAEITPMKESMKKHQKEADDARDKLVKGKPETVEVEETLDYEKGEVYSKRIDTGAELPTRKLVAGDHQTDTEDCPVNLELAADENVADEEEKE